MQSPGPHINWFPSPPPWQLFSSIWKTAYIGLESAIDHQFSSQLSPFLWLQETLNCNLRLLSGCVTESNLNQL